MVTIKSLEPPSEWLVCDRTRSALGQLGYFLEHTIDAEDTLLRFMALHLINQGGKRIRPTLLFLAATYGEFTSARLLRAAAALELVHVASLYHDDVMDRAALRRRTPSSNARWGNALATVTGTYLFARASALLSSLGNLPNQLASQASVQLCTGQLQEVENAYNLDLTELEHLDILAHKTATLFELPCRLGACLSQSSAAHTDALIHYGRNLGLAFQLTDDALDLVGQPGKMGKATGTDLREGVYSLSVLRALQQRGLAREQLRSILSQVQLTAADIETVISVLYQSGVVEEVLAVAQRYAQQAQTALEELPKSPARLSLHRLADYVITRST